MVSALWHTVQPAASPSLDTAASLLSATPKGGMTRVRRMPLSHAPRMAALSPISLRRHTASKSKILAHLQRLRPRALELSLMQESATTRLMVSTVILPFVTPEPGSSALAPCNHTRTQSLQAVLGMDLGLRIVPLQVSMQHRPPRLTARMQARHQAATRQRRCREALESIALRTVADQAPTRCAIHERVNTCEPLGRHHLPKTSYMS